VKIEQLLENQTKKTLLGFIVEYAENDSRLANAIHVRFGAPEFNAELVKFERQIDIALDDATDYRARGSWGHINVDLSDIIKEVYERAEQNHIRLAFAELAMLYRKLVENFEYQEECEIADEAEDCLRIMAEIADKATTKEDQDYIFRLCLELSELEDGKDYGADYEDKLLLISAKFVNAENVSELNKALALFESNTWRAEEFKLIRLGVIRKLNGNKAAAEFIAQNLEHPKIREIAFDNAVAKKDFEQAEHLCNEAISTYEHRFGISSWLYRLYIVHEKMEDKTKTAETARMILMQGDLDYYSKLKTLLSEDETWDNSYPKLLDECASILHHSQYMNILESECEYALLLAQLELHNNEVYRHGEFLASKYPQEVCDIYTAQIIKEAESVHGRESYRKVCSNIMLFSKAGYTDQANELIWDFMQKYKRKPAFVDELKKIQG